MVALLAALAVLVPVPGAGAAIYWTDTGGIHAARLDGGGVEPLFFQPGGRNVGSGYDLLATDTHLYWRGFPGIVALNLDGPANPVTVVGGISESGLVGGFGVGGGYVFWTNPERNSIGRVALDGSGRDNDLITLAGSRRPCDVTVRGQYVYWTGFGGIGRARLDGSEADGSFIPAAGGCSITADASHLYWASNFGGVARATLAGDVVEPAFIASAGRAESIAVLDGTVYWIDRPDGMVYPTVGRALPGQPPVTAWIPTTAYGASGVAVDARPEPEARPLPSRPIGLGQLRRNTSRGTAAIDVWVPERGELEVTSPAIGWKVLKGPEPPPYRGGTFRWRLKLWPGKAGKASARVKRQLARRGRAPLTLRLSYAETGQLPVTASKKLALLREPPRRLTKRSAGHQRKRPAG